MELVKSPAQLIATQQSLSGSKQVLKKRLILVGENRLARESLRHILESDSITIADSVESSVDLLPLLRSATNFAQLILIMQPNNDWAVARQITMDFRDIGIAVLASKASFLEYDAAMAAGVRAFLPESISGAALSLSLQVIALGENLCATPASITRAQQAPAVRQMIGQPRNPQTPLSVREWEVLDCVGSGLPNKMIARKLNIAEPTVKVHIKTVLRKIDVANRTQAAIWAINYKGDALRA